MPLIVLALMLLGAARADAVALPPDFVDTFVASANQPTSLAFVPGGRLLIAEEAGVVRVYENGSMNASPALDIRSRVCSDGERGLMAVAVDPQFESNRFIYLYYTWVKNGSSTTTRPRPVNRVSRFVLRDDDTVGPRCRTVLIDNIPAPAGYHIGADLQFGKDGLLYVIDRRRRLRLRRGQRLPGAERRCPRPARATGEDPADHARRGDTGRQPVAGRGTARCNVTGRTTAGNRCQETFAWGLRNPFRIAVDPNSPATRFFINDVGEITWEEVDLGQSGADYGWNVREGFCATGSTTDCGTPPAGMTNPVHAYSHEPSGCYAITGGAFVPKGIWSSSYDDDYLYADLVCGKIFRMSPAAGGGWDVTEWADGIESPITMTFGPAGGSYALYYVTWAGAGHEVRRITYTGADRAGYPRPVAASPVRVSLVPAYTPCGSPNRMHGPPLAQPACNPPAPQSQQLTVGTVDANGQSPAFAARCVSARDGRSGHHRGRGRRQRGGQRARRAAPCRPRGLHRSAGPAVAAADHRPRQRRHPFNRAGDGAGHDTRHSGAVRFDAGVGRLHLHGLDDGRCGRARRGTRGQASGLGHRQAAGDRRRPGRCRCDHTQRLVRRAGTIYSVTTG